MQYLGLKRLIELKLYFILNFNFFFVFFFVLDVVYHELISLQVSCVEYASLNRDRIGRMLKEGKALVH